MTITIAILALMLAGYAALGVYSRSRKEKINARKLVENLIRITSGQ